MRRGVEGVARAYWGGELSSLGRAALTVVTSPLAALFGVGVRLRTRAYDTGVLASRKAPVPVLSVGNLSVGGTGKTPVTRWVVEALLARGVRPGVVSRGYGEDEVALHRRWHPDLPVEADRDRVAAAERAAGGGAQVVVVDDGFQHRALARDADLVLVSAEDPFPPRLLPRGPYREPLSALGRASLVLVTSRLPGEELDRCLAEIRRIPRHPPVAGLRLVPAGWETLEGAAAPPPPVEGGLLVVASVARPEGVVEGVRRAMAAGPDLRLELMAWPDHHPYTASDVEGILARAAGRPVVTTAKDAVKLLPFQGRFPAGVAAPRALALGVEASPDATRLLGRTLDRVLARLEGGEG